MHTKCVVPSTLSFRIKYKHCMYLIHTVSERALYVVFLDNATILCQNFARIFHENPDYPKRSKGATGVNCYSF